MVKIWITFVFKCRQCAARQTGILLLNKKNHRMHKKDDRKRSRPIIMLVTTIPLNPMSEMLYSPVFHISQKSFKSCV